MAPKFVEIEGKRLLWRDVLRLRREQKMATAAQVQPALFELKNDSRPKEERTARDRYEQPSLLSWKQ
jgi:hypothetical protein